MSELKRSDKPLNYSFHELETFLKEQARIEASELQIRLQQDLRSQKRKVSRVLARNRQAEALRFQISINQELRHARERSQKEPGIDPTFNGFPNLPDLSVGLQWGRKRELQEKLKKDLEEQIRDKRKQRKLEALHSIKFDIAANARSQADLEAAKLLEAKKKERVKEELRKAQEEADRTKLLLRKVDLKAEDSVDILEIHPSPSTSSLSSALPSPLPAPASLPVLPKPRPQASPISSMHKSRRKGLKDLCLAVPQPVISTVKTIHLQAKRRPAYAITNSQPRVGTQLF